MGINIATTISRPSSSELYTPVEFPSAGHKGTRNPRRCRQCRYHCRHHMCEASSIVPGPPVQTQWQLKLCSAKAQGASGITAHLQHWQWANSGCINFIDDAKVLWTAHMHTVHQPLRRNNSRGHTPISQCCYKCPQGTRQCTSLHDMQ